MQVLLCHCVPEAWGTVKMHAIKLSANLAVWSKKFFILEQFKVYFALLVGGNSTSKYI